MITSYIIVLALSAWLIAALLIYVSKRFGKLFGNPLLISPGFVLLLPLLGFLVVVAAPAPMLVGCVVLVGAHLTRRGDHLPAIASFGVPLVAALLATTHVTTPIIAHVPTVALHLVALVILFAYTLTAERLPKSLAPTSMVVLASLIPLLAAPFLGAPSYIAVDGAILASVLLGANMAAIGTASVAIARQPFALILGWLVVTVAAHGAWIPAAISLLVYAGSLAMARTLPATELESYAS